LAAFTAEPTTYPTLPTSRPSANPTVSLVESIAASWEPKPNPTFAPTEFDQEKSVIKAFRMLVLKHAHEIGEAEGLHVVASAPPTICPTYAPTGEMFDTRRKASWWGKKKRRKAPGLAQKMDRVMDALRAYDSDPKALNARLGKFIQRDDEKKKAKRDNIILKRARKEQELERREEIKSAVEHVKGTFGKPAVIVTSHKDAAEVKSLVASWELPTPLPTLWPTIPTLAPTACPSATPTSSPSAIPTTTPSAIPTTSPSAIPTATPTGTPTAAPTSTPTPTPTLATSVPTINPTLQPSVLPTNTPTSAPTNVPTGSPSSPPTGKPTYMDKILELYKRHEADTDVPTPALSPTAPTAMPSDSPTSMPTDSPTAMPTTHTPTAVPTGTPTGKRRNYWLYAHYLETNKQNQTENNGNPS
jgi:hypothetical protein